MQKCICAPEATFFYEAGMTKPSTTYFQQMSLYRNRGCVIEDENLCETALQYIGYYRLSAYFLPFKNDNDDNYKSGTSFTTVYRLYEFDRELRSVLFNAIEEVEIAFRSQLSYYHATRFGPLGYMEEVNFNNRHDHAKFTELISKTIRENGTTPIVIYHQEKQNGDFPIWAIMELFTFGMLSHFYTDMIISDKKAFSANLGINDRDLESYLRCCGDLRNMCAHYSRLYYRKFSAIPKHINCLTPENERSLFGAVMALRALFPHRDKWNNYTCIALASVLEKYADTINLSHIGFPENWEDLIRK